MIRILISLIFAASGIGLFSQTAVTLTTDGRIVSATLADNAATRELVTLLQQGPLSVNMSDYGGFEKVGTLPRSFPTSDSRITTVPGDIMLYQGNQIVIFYGSNTWSYTPLGKIDGASAESMRSFLGSGAITLTIALPSTTGQASIDVQSNSEEQVYDLHGRHITERPLPSGLYIINGTTTLIR